MAKQKTIIECNNCGFKFKRVSHDKFGLLRCPNCKSYDCDEIILNIKPQKEEDK